MLISKNIFETIFIDCESIKKIDIITGYSSGIFLKNFVKYFNAIEINLYIGMSQAGILIDDHLIYKELTEKNENINVFYQIQGSLTHSKIIQITKKNDLTFSYVGSANFSFDGFFRFNEIMTSINDDTSVFFNEQYKRSKIVSSNEVNHLIIDKKEEERKINRDFFEDLFEESVKDISLNTFKIFSLSLRRNSKYFNKFDLLIVKETNLTEINFDLNEEIIIKIPNEFRVDMKFPKNEIISIYFENNIFNCELSGKFSKDLKFIGNDFYLFLRKLLQDNGQVFTMENLANSKFNKITLQRVNNTEYIMSFNS